MPKKKIAVVDNQPLLRQLVGLCLQTDFTVVEAAGGLEAQELLRTERPDLVLLDVAMPVIDGFETLLLRRSGPQVVAEQIAAGDLLIRPEERTATWIGRPVYLTPKEFELLALLANHPGQVFTRDRLLARVWGVDFDGDPRTVDSRIRNLREKLGEGGRMITTAWGEGYRFDHNEHGEQ